MRNRIGNSRGRKPKVQSRPIKEECNIVTQQDEKFCSTCGCRWSKRDDDFVCPKQRKG